ncbi:MAG: hypothetical protein KZQ76_01805 [Candidatus Thiodiazotropha sp. (ex Epidulcina cf. delphinae)]|nr:hypothetical protein [Candidatus Thiodiazotropha sp. (ex Epidulcina cf. delphinae)]
MGGLLVLLSFFYIAHLLWGYRDVLLSWRPSAPSFATLGVGVIIYGMANFALSSAWIRLLRLCGEHTVKQRTLTRIYGKSQIGKYIPGNIAHLAGRHAMGKAAGVSHTRLALTSIFEITGLFSAALIITLVGGNTITHQFDQLTWIPIIAPFILIIYLFTPSILHRHRPAIPSIPPVSMLLPLSYYLLFFLISGLALALICFVTGRITVSADNTLLLSAFAISWLIGFITPGAPSGIGIREAILVLLLMPLSGEGPALILALLFRLVTVGGDIVFFFLSQYSLRSENRPAA